MRRLPAATTVKTASENFTGDVYMDTVYKASNGPTGDMIMVNVFFTPDARTYWHTHEKGQLLRVMAGAGFVCDKGEEPKIIRTGDVVWCPPGTTHWHGAGPGLYMLHQATTFGKTEWGEEVAREVVDALPKL